MIRFRGAAGIGCAALLSLACAGVRHPASVPPGGPTAAVYRGRFDPGEGEKARRFRLLVHAARPDRLHGEVLSAVGTTELVLDAGANAVSVFFVRDRVAYVGESSERALGALLGVPLAVQTLVDVLVGNDPGPSTLEWNIVPGDFSYPQRIELGDGRRTLRLELKRLRAMRADPATLGTGRPPDGVKQLPLEALDAETLPGVETEREDDA